MNWEKLIQSGFRMPFYMNLYVRGSLEDVEKVIGLKYEDNLIVLERQINTVYFNPRLQQKIEDIIKNKITQKNFRDRFIAVFENTDRKLLKLCDSFRFIDYSKLGTDSLIKKLDKFSNLFKRKFGIYGLPVIVDLALVEKLPTILSNPISDDDLFTLTKSEKQSEYIEERRDFIQIILKIKKLALLELFNHSREEIFDKLGRYNPDVYYDLERHVRAFSWIGVSHHVLPMTMDTLLESIKIGLKDNSIDKELKSINTLNTKRDVTHYSQLNKSDIEVINFITKLNEIKEERKIAMCKAILWSYPLFEAISNVLNIDTISLRQLTLEEIKNSLSVGKLSNKQKMLMDDRLNLYVCMAKGSKIYNFSGDKAHKILEKELRNKGVGDIQELKGGVAQKGLVRGVVRLIMTEHQVRNLVEGEVLVSSMTDPDMIVAMKKASAFVTDEGGITCHAAIVARELKKPCIIGTKIATKVLKDGDLVEVDAEKGVVKILKRAGEK